MQHEKQIITLKDFARSYSDNEIVVAVAEYNNKRISEINSASESLNSALLHEWKLRHGEKPVPRVIPESKMVFQKGSSNSCKFIMHLL